MKSSIAALRASLAAFAFAALAACDGPTTPIMVDDGAATLHSSAPAGCPGNSGGSCAMSATVLMTASGGALLVVRTGGYDEATGKQTPNGTFDKVQWKIYDARGKLTSTKKSGADGAVFLTSLSGNFTVNHRVEVQANIRNHNGKKGTAVVKKTVAPVYAPDIDLTAERIDLLVDGTRKPLAPVTPGVSHTYVVDFKNVKTLGGTPSTTGIRTLCTVSVDGKLQIPLLTPGFAYVSNPYEYLGPGETSQCSFKLTLAKGNHTIKVTAVAADIFIDCNVNNNSTTASVTIGTPADLSVSRFERVVTDGDAVGAPNFGEVTKGTSNTFAAGISSPANSPAADATCSVVVTPVLPPEQIQWNAQAVHVNGGATQDCSFTLTPATPGTYTIAVTVTSAGDPAAANNTSTGTLVVKPAVDQAITANLILKAIPLATTVVDGGIDVVYTAAVGVLPGGTSDHAAYTCVATATRVSDNHAATITPMTMTGTATTTADGICEFRVGGMAAATQDQAYRITVTVTPTDANELLADDNQLTVTQAVQRKTIDLEVRSIERKDGDELFPLGQVTAGMPATYVARIGATGTGNQTGSAISCTARAINLRLPANIINSPDEIATGTATATPGQEATCEFSLNLPSNLNLDEDYRIEVTADPVGANELAAGNNTGTGNQKAIIRVNLGVAGVTMSIDGGPAQTDLTTIPKGKTATYTATFHNGSSLPAVFMCVATAIPQGELQPVPLVMLTNGPVNIGLGGDATCQFEYTYEQLIALNFTVSAVSVLPLDSDPADNFTTFQTTAKSDGTFPAIDNTNIFVLERSSTDANDVTTRLDAQQVNITRITLTFAATTSIIGDFVLNGEVTSGGNAISKASWTVDNLQPGTDVASCRIGVDPGHTSALPVNFELKVCAQEVSPGLQAIFIEYLTVLPGTVNNPAPAAVLGDNMIFKVALDWTIEGSSVHDRATAELQFGLRRRTTGDIGEWIKNQVGEVIVIRNGGA